VLIVAKMMTICAPILFVGKGDSSFQAQTWAWSLLYFFLKPWEAERSPEPYRRIN
jgi:hypothetical protein